MRKVLPRYRRLGVLCFSFCLGQSILTNDGGSRRRRFGRNMLPLNIMYSSIIVGVEYVQQQAY